MNKIVYYTFLGWMLFAAYGSFSQEEIALGKAVISLDLYEVEIRQALTILAKFARFNLILEESVHGKITLHFHQVSIEEAIQSILAMKKLVQQKLGNTRIIRSNSNLFQEESIKETFSLKNKRIIVQHRNPNEIRSIFLKMQTHQTEGSELKADAVSNSLWIRDTPDRIKVLEDLVSNLDQATQQVFIEARIVSINRNFDNSLGFRFNLKQKAEGAIEKGVNTIEEHSIENKPHIPSLSFDFTNSSQVFNRIGPLLWTGFNRLLDLELAIMESEGQGRVISSPHLITTDKTPALIEAGSEIPYQEKGRYGTSIAFKKAVLCLQVTPEVKSVGKILLKLEVQHDKPSVLNIEKTPAIDTQKLKTQVLIQAGETIALGGIYETISQENIYRVPGLGKLPLLGWLFTQKHQVDSMHELVVFITPQLVSDQFLKQRKTAYPYDENS